MTDVLERRFVLPADATLARVGTLPEHVRDELRCEDEDDWAVGRAGYRVPARLVSPQLGALLEQFRRPTRIADAIARFSRAERRDPYALLEEAFDALADCIEGQVLVPADEPVALALAASVAPGERVGACVVERAVRVVEDSEVHLALLGDRAVALKIVRAGARPGVTEELRTEAAVLGLLAGGAAPALLGEGEHEGRPYLLLEWRSGEPVTVAADRLRGDRAALGALCRAVAAAYAWLHGRGVVHADVHPGNVLAGERGVTLLDFGRARPTGDGPRTSRIPGPVRVSAGPGTDLGRAGMVAFYEPEMARALLASAPPPRVTPAAEQYAVATLVYRLVTGMHPLDLPAERTAALVAIADRPMLPFPAQAVRAWPSVESVLARALSKQAADRFPSVAAFAEALDGATRTVPPPRPRAAPSLLDAPPRTAPPPCPGAASALLDRALDAARDLSPAARGRAEVADLAWFSLRAAVVRDDPDLLACADVWATRAAAPGDWGAHAVAAAVHRARGDRAAHAASASALLAACAAVDDRPDVLGGRSGAVLACATALDRLSHGEVRDALAAWMRDTAAGTPLPAAHLGVAHGVAGVLLAALRAGRPAEGLDALAAAGVATPLGLAWPGVAGLAPGWCGGSAGFVLLWTEAHRKLGEPRFLDLAVRAGEHAATHPADGPDVCCGTSGRGLALLQLHRATGDPRWLEHTERLSHAAAAKWDGRDLGTLRRGPLGTALLLLELEAPELAVFPPLRT